MVHTDAGHHQKPYTLSVPVSLRKHVMVQAYDLCLLATGKNAPVYQEIHDYVADNTWPFGILIYFLFVEITAILLNKKNNQVVHYITFRTFEELFVNIFLKKTPFCCFLHLSLNNRIIGIILRVHITCRCFVLIDMTTWCIFLFIFVMFKGTDSIIMRTCQF